MSAHLSPERAYEVAGLPESDPERREATAHAGECPGCRRLLDEAHALFAALDALPAPPPPSQAALARARAAVLAELSAPAQTAISVAARPAPSSRRGAWRWLPAAAAAIAFALDVALARRHDRGAPALALVTAALAATGALLVANGRRVAVAGIVAASLLAVLVAGGGGELDPALGIKCALHELAVSLLPLGATAWLAASRRVAVGPLGFATAAAAGALAGQASLHLACPDSAASPHLLAFHFGGVVLAALVGAAISRVPRLRPAE